MNCLRRQLLVQQQWLPTITSFKLFQMWTFSEFLNRCAKFSKVGVATKILDDVMSAHPSLDLIRHESYDPEAILKADDDLMKSAISAPLFLYSTL